MSNESKTTENWVPAKEPKSDEHELRIAQEVVDGFFESDEQDDEEIPEEPPTDEKPNALLDSPKPKPRAKRPVRRSN